VLEVTEDGGNKGPHLVISAAPSQREGGERLNIGSMLPRSSARLESRNIYRQVGPTFPAPSDGALHGRIDILSAGFLRKDIEGPSHHIVRSVQGEAAERRLWRR
jgi:hypothetical protein